MKGFEEFTNIILGFWYLFVGCRFSRWFTWLLKALFIHSSTTNLSLFISFVLLGFSSPFPPRVVFSPYFWRVWVSYEEKLSLSGFWRVLRIITSGISGPILLSYIIQWIWGVFELFPSLFLDFIVKFVRGFELLFICDIHWTELWL